MNDDAAGALLLWSAGDYPRVAERFEPVATALVEGLGTIRGLRWLDVAAGTGNVALWLAIRDIEDKRARARAKESGLPADQRRAPGKLVESSTVLGWNKPSEPSPWPIPTGSGPTCTDDA